jgi:D-alanyl-D-alanine dipeptidase
VSGTVQPDARAYWTQSLEEAWTFMEQVRAVPLAETGEPLADIPSAARDAGVDLACSDRPHADGGPRRFWIRRSILPRLLAVAAAMNRLGWVLKLEDAYRTPDMQRALLALPLTLDGVLRKVVAELDGRLPDEAFLLRRLSCLVALFPITGTHMGGTAVDVSVLRSDGRELDRGGPYLEISERTPFESPFISAGARANRRRIAELFAEQGFVAYPFEFWHFSQGDVYEALLRRTGRPAPFGPVHATGPGVPVAPVLDPQAPLLNLAQVRALVAAARQRLGAGVP